MNASLDKMLREVEWGEYRLGDLFEIENTLSFNADCLVEGTEYDYVTRTSLNQGVLRETGFVNKTNLNRAGIWSLGLLQMDFFYRERPWYAGQFVRKVIPKIDLTPKVAPFFSTLLNMQKPKLLSVLVRYVDDTFRNTKISLPIKNGEINFPFMEKFIAELEAQRIAELQAYLLAAGLTDYILTAKEEKALQELNTHKMSLFRIGSLFEKVKTNKLSYKANDLPKIPTKENPLPCLTSSFHNQGLNYYIPVKGATVLKNVISIPSNSDVYRAYFQSRDFTVLSDSYAIRWKYTEAPISPKQYLFFVQCINKVTDLPIFSYKNKLGGWNVVKDLYIALPIKAQEIDLPFMDLVVSAIQKLVIKDVVLYAEEKVNATKTVVIQKSLVE